MNHATHTTGEGSARREQSLHVCILTTAHPLDDVRVNHKFAESFLDAGFRVTWVGPDHSFFGGRSTVAPGFELRLAAPNRRRLDRLMAPRRVAALARGLEGVDVYYAPEPDAAGIAIRLARRNHARVILDLHEIYHGPMLDRWLRGWRLPSVRAAVRRHIARICRRCDLVLGVNSAVLGSYVPADEPGLVVRSCAPAWFADGPAADVCSPRRQYFTIMHGKRSLARGTPAVLETVALASRSAANLRVVMFNPPGPSPDPEYTAFHALVERHSVGAALDLRDGVPMRQIPQILRTCDIGVIAYGRELGQESLPNRLFEYMAAGLPVVVPSYAPEMAAIVNAESCGVTADFEDPADIARAILRLWSNPAETRVMGRRSREAFLARHNWTTEIQPVLARMHEWQVRKKSGRTP